MICGSIGDLGLGFWSFSGACSLEFGIFFMAWQMLTLYPPEILVRRENEGI
jgi:hypothetical protein